jgi:tetratricopeptide (TPR) repeat protein
MHHLRTDHSKAAQFFAAFLSAAFCVAVSLAAVAAAAELPAGEQLFRTGKYAECARVAAQEIDEGTWEVDWHILKANSELAEGKYQAAARTLKEALDEHGGSLRLRLLARAADRFNGNEQQADFSDEEIGRLLAVQERFDSLSDRVALGRFLLDRGADPRQILELVYDPLRKAQPNFAEAYFAMAELALDKCDNALAAETLQTAPKSLTQDPQYHYLLARAFATDEPARAQAAIEAALAINPKHVDSLLLRIDRLIDAEEYVTAESQLERVLAVNPNHPKAWAYKAVLAHLASDAKSEEAAHKQALSTWPKNPEVDHIIGNKLSQSYRFKEGAAYQRKALGCDPNFRPAKLQLSQDLLRLGEEAEGWRLADEVAKQDAYDVVAFNLVTLQDELQKFRTIGDDGLKVRMEAREADLYGDRAVELLKRARKTLCEKYDVKLDGSIVIEIFPKQKDFDVRTFGMPGVARGYLGVCFGRVITANSPASQGERPANWESVLWHEFCHVVTLHKTHNKMPRWLSEGISVYEERQVNPSWGASMNPQFREFILYGEMTPVSQLSSAFLAPKTPVHLQFAYFESSLVVEYLVERFGMDKLRALLVDLGDGKDINEALVVHTEPLNRLDADFAAFARKRAETLAIEARWDKPELPPDADADSLAAWVTQHPDSVPGLKQLAAQQVRDRKFERVIETAKHLREIFPNDVQPNNAYALLAAAHRGLGDFDAEREALEELASRNDSAVDVYLRLMEIAESKQDWEAVAKNAHRMLAVNPLVAAPHRYLAKAAEQLNRRDEAIRANKALLTFDTTDIAETHFRLAKLLRDETKTDAARRHALMALEEAPRYLAAHKLLLELTEDVRESNTQVVPGSAGGLMRDEKLPSDKPFP